jgi:hypothetical protein
MDIKRKTCYIRNWERIISRQILQQRRHTCPIALPVRRNRQLTSRIIVVSHFRTWTDIICVFRTYLKEFLYPVVIRFRRLTLPTVTGIFIYAYHLHWGLLLTKTQKRTLLFCIALLKHGRYFDYWNQLLNMRMRVCYLGCHMLLSSDTHREAITSITAIL